MGGLGDRLSVDVNCAGQIDKQRFDHRSTRHVGWRWLRGLCFGVGVIVKGCSESASSRQPQTVPRLCCYGVLIVVSFPDKMKLLNTRHTCTHLDEAPQ